MNWEALLFGLTLLLYFVSSVCYHLHLFAGSERARQVAIGTVVAAVLVHTAAIGVWCVNHRGMSILRDPGMVVSLMAYFLAIVQFAANFRKTWSALGSLTMPLAFIAEFYGGVATPGTAYHAALAESASGPLMRPHVTALLLSFAALALAFCLAIVYLVQSRLLKAKQVRGLFSRLPPLDSVGTAAHWLAAIGFSMLTLGIVTGAMAAPHAWGGQWYLDPRTVTSIVAWLIYAAYLGAVMLLGWRGRKTTYFLIAGFLVVLVAFFASSTGARTTTAPQGNSAHRWSSTDALRYASAASCSDPCPSVRSVSSVD
jgi:ABC-type uncharacterized transport system permease subunit